MAAISDLSNMAATEGAHLGSLEKLVGDGYISPWSKNGACGMIWTIIWLSKPPDYKQCAQKEA